MNTQKEDGVVTTITVLTLGILVMAISFTVAMNSVSQISKNRNLFAGDRLFYAAEAQAREGIYQYMHDPSYAGGDPLPINGSTDGSITTEALEWPFIEITSTAENDLVQRKIVYTITMFPEGLGFDHALYSRNDLSLGGNVTVNGDIFANNNVLVGGSSQVQGDAYSPNNIEDPGGNVSGEAYLGVEPIPAAPVDTAPYHEKAVSDDYLFDSGEDAEDHLNNRYTEGVVFIEGPGTTNIQGTHTELLGSLVSTGDIRISGGTITAAEDHMALIVLGDLRITGGSTINGIVYVTGETSFGAGNNTINGSLISAGGGDVTVEVSGNGTINYNSGYIFALHKLIGVSGATSSEVPRITNWREE